MAKEDINLCVQVSRLTSVSYICLISFGCGIIFYMYMCGDGDMLLLQGSDMCWTLEDIYKWKTDLPRSEVASKQMLSIHM